MNKKSFSFLLVFEGKAISHRTFPVENFSSVWLSLNTVLAAMNKEANSSNVNTKISINAPFFGAFEVNLTLSNSLQSTIKSLFKRGKLPAYVNAESIFFAFVGLLHLKKFLMGYKPDSVVPEDGRVRYKIGDKGPLVSVLTHEVFVDKKINKACDRIFAPLALDGVDRVRLIFEDCEAFSIEKSELSAFIAKDLTEKTLSKVTLQIVGLDFDVGAKWQVILDKKRTVLVSISDQSFLSRVDSGKESFAKGDVLVADLNVMHTIQKGMASVAYDIVKVWEHRHAYQHVEPNFGKQ